MFHLPQFYHLLKSNNQDGKLIKSLHITPPGQLLSQDKRTEGVYAFAAISGLPFALGVQVRANYGIQKAIGFVYEQIHNLQVLRLENFALCFDFIRGETGAPQLFLSKSLKRLFIAGTQSREGVDHSLSANNAIWLLSFCPQLDQCSLAILVSHKDYKFVSELSNSFEGLSNVKHLALQFCFIFDSSKRNTWWGLPEEQNQGYLGNSKKTETLYRFLKVTKKLLSLELGVRNLQK